MALRNGKRLAALLLAALALPLLTAGAQDLGTLRVRFFKIGKADAFLLRTSRHVVLIDAGEDDDAPEIIDYLADNGITELDCLILSHFDKRSIGGAQELLESVPAKRILMPDGEKDSTTAGMLFTAMAGMNTEKVAQDTAFEMDGVSFSVLTARGTDYGEETDNNISLVVSVTHGQSSFLFAGDIMEPRIAEMAAAGQLTPHTVLKMPCHGQYIPGLAQLLDAVKPQIAVIPASVKNPPAGATISDLEGRGVRWYSTHQGSITLVSDGYSVAVSQNKK